MILLNFKTYKESTGENAVLLSQNLSVLSSTCGVEVVACPQLIDFRAVQSILSTQTWAQHADPEERGRATGWVLPEVLKEAGATGVILNHSEHKLSFEVLAKVHTRCKEAGLKTLIFAGTVEEAKQLAVLSPDWIGYEPPELIASKDTSVARAKPDVIRKVVEGIPNIPILVGAGVKDREDVRVSLRLGAKGVGLASGVILSEDPKSVLEDLMKGFQER